MIDHDTLERIARQLAADHGCDYDRKHAKRAHWRKRALRVIAYCDSSSVLGRLFGWVA